MANASLRDGDALRSALDIAARIRAGLDTPAAVLDACLARIEASQPTINAYVTVSRDQARSDAERAAAAPHLPLAGVPFSVKDNIETAGVRTTYGSRTLADDVPKVGAVAVARLRAAGAVMVGKTTLPEFASSLLGTSPLTGVTRNPWNLDCSPGGSSSGAAAAVAAGLGPIALTTDAGASTRVPAALCGVLGIKPSIGLIPYELFPDGFGNFIHMGLITRTVADMAAALDAVSGEEPDDPLTIGVAKTAAHAALSTPLDLAGRRIAWRPFMGNSALDDEVRALCEAALGQFRTRGATVETISEPYASAAPTWLALQRMNWAGRFGNVDDATAQQMDAAYVAGLRAGLATSGTDFNAAIYQRTRYFRLVQSWLADFEWMATPVTTVAGIPADARGDTVLTMNGKPGGELRAAFAPYLNVFNLSGHPALSVPAGFTRSGLPVGIQLVGRLYRDTDLLRLAKVLEDAQPWAGRVAPHAPA